MARRVGREYGKELYVLWDYRLPNFRSDEDLVDIEQGGLKGVHVRLEHAGPLLRKITN